MNKSTTLDTMMPLIREQLATGGSVTFSPHGTSMMPMLRQGKDSVKLSPLPERLKKYDLPLYQRTNGQYVLHRIVKVSENCYTCIGDNQFLFEHGVPQAQMIAVVTAFNRGDREVSVDSFAYQLYCRVWHYTRPIRRLIRGAMNLLHRVLRAVFGQRGR